MSWRPIGNSLGGQALRAMRALNPYIPGRQNQEVILSNALEAEILRLLPRFLELPNYIIVHEEVLTENPHTFIVTMGSREKYQGTRQEINRMIDKKLRFDIIRSIWENSHRRF